MNMLRYIQNMGRSFMFPVSVLPAVALLVGLGFIIIAINDAFIGWEYLNVIVDFVQAGGFAVLDALAILFAVGLAFGMTKDKSGAAAVTGLVSFTVVSQMLQPENVAAVQGIEVGEVSAAFDVIDNNVLIGIVTGLISAALYNRFSDVKLPDYLAFFSGRRAVPIIAAFTMVLVAIVMFFVWPFIYDLLFNFGQWISGLGSVGAGLYGFFNRLLIPTGLHHALNSVFWFDTVGINDIGDFLASEGEQGITGRYQAGFFPIMMFGLPGAALAMYHTAKSEYRKVAASILFATAFTAFLTGVTEPMEFSFMFLAPLLYVVHALLTGFSMFIAAAFEWTAGFSFSAGAIDFVLSSFNPIANQPYMLLVQGLVFFAIYYFLFRIIITKFDLLTPGRDASIVSDEDESDEISDDAPDSERVQASKYTQQADKILIGLGGKENIDTLDYCTTRLRININDDEAVDESMIKSSGAHGITRPGKNNIQVVVGTEVEHVAEEMKKLM